MLKSEERPRPHCRGRSALSAESITRIPMTPQQQLQIDPRPVRVALAGCGVVGGGFARLLHESAPAIAARFGIRFSLTRVLVRDVHRERDVPFEPRLFTNDLDSFL